MCCAQCMSRIVGRQVVKQYCARVHVDDVYLQLFFVRTQLKRNHCIVIAGTCYYYCMVCVYVCAVRCGRANDDIIAFGSKISNARP